MCVVEVGYEANHGRGVIGLAKIAVDPTGACGVDDGAMPLPNKLCPYRFRHLVRSIEVHLQNWVP